jgi:hypothetical protein
MKAIVAPVFMDARLSTATDSLDVVAKSLKEVALTGNIYFLRRICSVDKH